MTILVGRRAPDFTASAVMADGQIEDDFRLADWIDGYYGVLFFYPLNFTFVCPSELIALDNRMSALSSLRAKVVAISIDSQFNHAAFRDTCVDKGGIGEVRFPLVSDLQHKISEAYGVQALGEHSFYQMGVAMRATFVIDPKGIVRHQVVNDEPVGRNMDEIIRVIEALEHHDQNGRVCPAGWQKGQDGMLPTRDGVAQFLGKYWSEL